MRCRLCGDSQKNKSKARGWLLENKDGRVTYYCHNCNASHSFENFVKQIDPNLHNEYILESKVEQFTSPSKPLTDTQAFEMKMKTPVFVAKTALSSIKKISQLAWDHPAKQYINSRKIPPPYHSSLFYAPKFKKWVNTLVPGKFTNINNDEPRLIIPFLNTEKKLVGLQGRSFAKDGIRYITIMLDEDAAKVYNIDRCNRSRQHYILEGPIDSMFVKNAVAMAGGSVDWSFPNEHSVFVFDNEPRSADTVRRMNQAIDKGYKVVFFPESIAQKDINQMVLENSTLDIMDLLTCNIYSGLQAKVRMMEWKKI